MNRKILILMIFMVLISITAVSAMDNQTITA